MPGFTGRDPGESSWDDVAQKRNGQDISAYRPRGWDTPTQETSQWAKKPVRDAEAEQRKYDEVELRKATYTKKSLWSRETKYDKDGREIKDPSRKKSRWSDGIF